MTPKIKKFDAAIDKVLHLVINSIYSNKDIFLRELISNSSDACDKLRYSAIQNHNLVVKDHEYKIQVKLDKKSSTIEILDTGIGMSEDDLINNLGTIAKSGTARFLDEISSNPKKDIQCIGQFGVGFYSAFMVSDKVTVRSKKAGEDQAFQWESDGKKEYSVIPVKDHSVGTSITLKIKDDAKNFLEKEKLKSIITTYSDHISFPIEFLDSDNKQNAELVNKASALWQNNPKNISSKEYDEFFNHISHLPGKP